MPILTEQRNPYGELSFWFVVPSRNLRRLILNYLMKTYPAELNYLCEWKDTHGYGLHFTRAAWKTTPGIYVVPN